MYACMHPLFRVNDYNHGVFRHRRALSPFPLWNPESRMVKGHFSRYSRHPGIRISIWIIKTINLSRIPRREFLQWCDASWSHSSSCTRVHNDIQKFRDALLSRNFPRVLEISSLGDFRRLLAQNLGDIFFSEFGASFPRLLMITWGHRNWKDYGVCWHDDTKF